MYNARWRFTVLIIKTTPQSSSYVLKVIAGESLTCPACDVSEIEGIGEVVSFYTYERSDPYPTGLLLLSIGKLPENIWQVYAKSEKIYFFLCRTESKA